MDMEKIGKFIAACRKEKRFYTGTACRATGE